MRILRASCKRGSFAPAHASSTCRATKPSITTKVSLTSLTSRLSNWMSISSPVVQGRWKSSTRSRCSLQRNNHVHRFAQHVFLHDASPGNRTFRNCSLRQVPKEDVQFTSAWVPSRTKRIIAKILRRDVLFSQHLEGIHLVFGCHLGRNPAGTSSKRPRDRSRTPVVDINGVDENQARRAFTVPLQSPAMGEHVPPHLRGLRQTAVPALAPHGVVMKNGWRLRSHSVKLSSKTGSAWLPMGRRQRTWWQVETPGCYIVPEHLTHPGAGCTQELDHAETECARIRSSRPVLGNTPELHRSKELRP